MSRLTDLLARLRIENAALAADLEKEISALTDRRAFGLNFERHIPETVELPGRKIRKGDKVMSMYYTCGHRRSATHGRLVA